MQTGRCRKYFAVLFFSFLCFSLFAEEPMQGTANILSWQRNFVRSSLGAKVEILRDASGQKEVAQFAPLYEQALDFALSFSQLLGEEPLMKDLIMYAAQGLAKTEHRESLGKLWTLFLSWRDSAIRVSILKSLAILGEGDGQTVDNLNQYLATQNSMFQAGMTLDYPALEACIQALGSLKNASSFPMLFSAMVAGYPEYLTQRASEALRTLGGDYRKNLIDVIRRNPPKEKMAAFKEGTGNALANVDVSGDLAEAALEVALDEIEKKGNRDPIIEQLRTLSIRELKRQRWSKATPLVIRHFHLVQGAASVHESAELSKRWERQLVEAIETLGYMGDSRAAQVLSLYLGLINAEMERSKTYNENLVSATIEALGELGDKMAFDYLLYTGYLPYPESIKALARAALTRLQW